MCNTMDMHSVLSQVTPLHVTSVSKSQDGGFRNVAHKPNGNVTVSVSLVKIIVFTFVMLKVLTVISNDLSGVCTYVIVLSRLNPLSGK